jgi:hypothetical protein
MSKRKATKVEFKALMRWADQCTPREAADAIARNPELVRPANRSLAREGKEWRLVPITK